MQDLNRRKDYSCSMDPNSHDAAYLAQWVSTVVVELQRRGYTLDGAGNLYRPAARVPLR